MFVIDERSAETYLRDSRRMEPETKVRIERLAGGVSNEVLYVSFPGRPEGDFVLKQAREQLRVAAPWFCSVERIWREVEVLRICRKLLAAWPDRLRATTPAVLFEDRENYCFAMTAAPREHVLWKRQLLAGEADANIAAECGQLLGALHAASWGDQKIAERLDDRSVFDQLRLDPYYRYTASCLGSRTRAPSLREDPESAQHLHCLVDEVLQNRCCLVHADFSPKNLLVHSGGLLMVDFETGHYGDGAFDLGFFLSHLVLKTIFHRGAAEFLALPTAFLEAYSASVRSSVSVEEFKRLLARGMRNLAGCVWARVDGKSPVEYLTDPHQREEARMFAKAVFQRSPRDWDEAREFLLSVLRGGD
ncbi:MAG: aminoglycoside phosphotransferase family protein [Planctomycetia bacterium]|nr:aminoglycoside phosphotransferase family protein [Planctomycetia bacterium]